MVRLRGVGGDVVGMLVTVVCSGCALGPTALKASRIPYNEVIQKTTGEQLLLNLVRLQYREAPVFVEVGSVAAQFSFEDSAIISGTLNENVGMEPLNPDSLTLGAQIRYQEQPTITYAPLQGEDFVRRLLTPVPLETVVLLSRSGWSVDRVLPLTVQGMNGLDNASRASGPTPPEAPRFERFQRVSRRLRELQNEGLLEIGYEAQPTELSEPLPAQAVTPEDLLAAARDGYRFRSTDDGNVVLTGSEQVLVWRIPPVATESEAVGEIVELLGLLPGQKRYELRATGGELAPSEPPGQRTRIEVATRSLMGTLFYLSHAVQVPPRHRELGFVTTTRDERGQLFDWSLVTGDLLRVRSGRMPPRRSAVGVPYGGYWFYIDNADLTSKSTFALLGQLLALQAGQEIRVSPVLTLPVGG